LLAYELNDAPNDMADVAEKDAYDALIDFVEANDLNGSQYDPRSGGWDKIIECIHCGKPSALLGATYDKAEYECRGNPTDPKSAYGDDRCGRVFTVECAER
jgi:hypothetical protein